MRVRHVVQENGPSYTVEWFTREEVQARYGFDPLALDDRALKSKLEPEGDRTVRYYLREACESWKAANP